MTMDVIVVGGPAGGGHLRRLARAHQSVCSTGATTAGYEGLSSRACRLLEDEGVLRYRVACGPLQRSGEWGAGRRVSGTDGSPIAW